MIKSIQIQLRLQLVLSPNKIHSFCVDIISEISRLFQSTVFLNNLLQVQEVWKWM